MEYKCVPLAHTISQWIVSRDRESEGAWERLAATLLANGDRRGALRAIESATEILTKELGIAPGARLEELARQAREDIL